MAKIKRSKNQIRREKAKLRKTENSSHHNVVEEPDKLPATTNTNAEEIVVLSRTEIEDNPLYAQFHSVFDKFLGVNDVQSNLNPERGEVVNEIDENDENESSESESDEEENVSKRQLRKRNKIPLATLKASTSRPQVVEWYDVDAHDPYILIDIKSQPNVVQVPEHWSSKREYLSSRRGIEKLPFQLPKFIRDTGIQDMRNNDDLTLKQQQREKVQPKMGKLDIDYQKLHDAFFKFQSKPRLFGYGDIYFEGREGMDEYGDEIARIKPGVVSKSLRHALGMQENDLAAPPPWLDIMINIGKPPAYANLLIPGLDMEYSNDGYKSFNFEDEFDALSKEMEVNGTHWGALEDVEDTSEEEEEEDDEDHAYNLESEIDQIRYVDNDDNEPDESGNKVAISHYGGIKSRDNVESSHDDSEPKQLYTVIKENRSKSGDELINTEFGYEISNKTNIKERENDSKAESNDNTKTKSFKF